MEWRSAQSYGFCDGDTALLQIAVPGGCLNGVDDLSLPLQQQVDLLLHIACLLHLPLQEVLSLDQLQLLQSDLRPLQLQDEALLNVQGSHLSRVLRGLQGRRTQP